MEAAIGKALKIVAGVVGIAALVIPGVGPMITGTLGGVFAGGNAALLAGGAGAALAHGAAATITSALMMAGLSLGMSTVAGVLGLGPKPPTTSAASTDRLNASLDVRAPRKIVFGYTAAATDLQYQEYTGGNQDYLNSIITLSSHSLHSIEEVWFDELKAWDSSGYIASKYTGFLNVTARTEGTAANAFTITGSTSWTSSASRMVGCGYLWLRYYLTGTDSPFASNITSRITVRARGAKLYDPRLDSTAGGSGSHRANDQTTWAWVNDNVGRNPALQLLWYLLGWRIQSPIDGTWKLAVGLGLPVARIDIPSFIAAANLCDESVVKIGGGTEPRYRSDGVFSEADDPSLVFENLCAAMNGVLRDNGGKLALNILYNDLGSPVVDLTAADVIDGFTWIQTPPIDQHVNVVRGKYVNSTDAGLYQLVDYPDVSLGTTLPPDGIERAKTFNFALVQSASQASRLAKTYLQRAQYPGTFSADFLATAWRCQVGSIIRLTFPALGFTNKLFRVVEHSIRFDGRCPMTLREENAAIYAWDGSEAPAVTAAAPVSYDQLNDPLRVALADAIALVTSRGQLTIGGPLPSLGASSVGDTHIADDGTFYERVNDAGILLDGFAVTLAGYRPRLGWTLSDAQPLRDVILQADAAYVSANDAIDQLAGLADDGTITINEKITKLIPENTRLSDKWTALTALAGTLGVSTSAASTARSGWLALLASLSPAWNNTTQDSPVDRTAFDLARDAYDAALYELDRAIKAQAAAVATWAGVSGSGKPADNATVGAPTGTPVGSITAGDVSSTINSGGGVATNQVNTAAIQNNAVTALGYVFSSGFGSAGSVSNTYPTWDTAQTLVVTATGQPLQVAFALNGVNTGTPGYVPRVELRLTRNGTEIFSGAQMTPTGDASDYRYCEVIDTPSAGSTTYVVQTRAYSPVADVGASFNNRLIKAVELKK